MAGDLQAAESLGLRATRAGLAGNDNLNALDVPEPGTLCLLWDQGFVAMNRLRASAARINPMG